jgi:glycosyltransferase involved in cell wall biosynthesis
MKVMGIISSPDDPASRARILQYVPYFMQKGQELFCKFFRPFRDANPPKWSYILKKITGINEWRSSDFLKSVGRIPLLFSQSGYDIIWQNRLIQLQHTFWENRLKKPVVFDLDDAIWINEGETQVRKKIEMSQLIFAGNEYLAEYASRFNANVKIIPTTIDTNTLYPLPPAPGKFIIGWSGTQSNFQYLESIMPPLTEFLKSDPDACLMIVSSAMPGFLTGIHKQVIFKKWDARYENELVNQFSVGIMPLADNEWTKGKCGYKLLQYLACGKPVIASPVGVNGKILTEADIGFSAKSDREWYNAFWALKNDYALAIQKGNAGRKLVLDKYSCSVWTNQIIDYMKYYC